MQDENEDSCGFADYMSDAVYFLLAVAIAVAVSYLAVIVLRPDVWFSL